MADDPVNDLTSRELEVIRYIAAGWSNDEIAARLVVSLNTVRWYNKQIYRKLNVTSRTQAIARAKEAGLLNDQAASVGDVTGGYLPIPATSFVGRAQQIEDLTQALTGDALHLVTLSGAPGVGKTRLALQIGQALERAFADGVYFVDLAPITDAARVAETIAAVFALPPVKGQSAAALLKRYFRQKELLLILDNFEHVIEAAPLLTDLLALAPFLKMIVTSREVLRLSTEHEFHVPPLILPDADSPDADQTESVQLFVQRARPVRPDFALTPENIGAVAGICVRLDGLPLAIELATARLRLLTPADLLARLGDRLDALDRGPRDLPARQQTLRSTIGWSYDLLGEAEQRLFARLGVFVGGWSVEAAEAISEGLGIDALDGIESLMLKSLVGQHQSADGGLRFSMLETIREYALEQLANSGEADSVRRMHADYYLHFTEAAQAGFWESEHRQWILRQRAEVQNVRAALQFFEDHALTGQRLRLIGALLEFMFASSSFAEGMVWAESALQAIDSDTPPLLVAKVHHMAGLMAFGLGYFQRAIDLYTTALNIHQQAGDAFNTGVSLYLIAAPIAMSGDLVTATEQTEEARRLITKAGSNQFMPMLYSNLGQYYLTAGDFARGQQTLEEGLEVARRTRNDLGAIYLTLSLTVVALARGDLDQIKALCAEVIPLCEALGIHRMTAVFALFVGMVDEREGRFADAQANYQRSVRLANRYEETPIEIRGLIRLSALMRQQGSLDQAAAYARQAAEASTHSDDTNGMIAAIRQNAGIFSAKGEAEPAIRLYAAASVDAITDMYSFMAVDHTADLDALRQHPNFDAVWSVGQALKLSEALAIVR